MIGPSELVADGRAEAEALMIDTCVIRAASSNSSFDEASGAYVTTPGAVLYTGPCKRQSPAGVRAEIIAEAADHNSTLSRLQLHIPASAPQIPLGALVTLTAAPLEPRSIGRRWRVDGPAGKSFATAQRLNVMEVVG